MQIELQNVKQTTELCRYCLMCRHVCPVTHVTRSEATSPHGWGILIASVKRGVAAWNEDTVDVLYQCSDCGLCQAHCVTDQPLPLAISASRADVVDQQSAPTIVSEIRDRLRQWQNPYVETGPPHPQGQGPAALIIGAVGHHLQPETVAAATTLLARAGVTVIPIAIGRESPYLANTLGLAPEARTLAEQTLDEIKQVGAKQVFVLSPGEVYAHSVLLDYLGLSWPETVELLEVTTFLADQIETGLTFSPTNLSDFAFFDPDQTVRQPGRWESPRKLLAALSDTPPIELFWRKERAAPCGASGGLPFTHPALSAQLALARLTEAKERGVNTIITDAPASLHQLRTQAAKSGIGIEVKGLFELLADKG